MTVYRIADVVFNPDACELTASGETQHVQPQVRNVLLSLVRHEGEVVPKDLLVEEAWHGRRTSAANGKSAAGGSAAGKSRSCEFTATKPAAAGCGSSAGRRCRWRPGRCD